VEFVGPTWGQLSSSQRRLSRTKLWLTAPGASWTRSSGATPLHLHCTIPWRALSTPPHRKQNTRLHRQCIASQPVAASGGTRRLSGRGGQVPIGGRIPACLNCPSVHASGQFAPSVLSTQTVHLGHWRSFWCEANVAKSLSAASTSPCSAWYCSHRIPVCHGSQLSHGHTTRVRSQ